MKEDDWRVQMQDEASWLTCLDQLMRLRWFHKFKDILRYSDPNIDSVKAPFEIAQRDVAEKKGENWVEFFNIWSSAPEFDDERSRATIADSGAYMQKLAGAGIKNYRFVPADLKYSVWVWTQYKNRLQRIASRFLFWRYQNPLLDVIVDNAYHMPMILQLDGITDESNFSQKYERGKIFVYRFDFILKGWVLDEDTPVDGTKIIKSIQLNISDSTKDPNFVQLDTDWIFQGSQIGMEDTVSGLEAAPAIDKD